MTMSNVNVSNDDSSLTRLTKLYNQISILDGQIKNLKDKINLKNKKLLTLEEKFFKEKRKLVYIKHKEINDYIESDSVDIDILVGKIKSFVYYLLIDFSLGNKNNDFWVDSCTNFLTLVILETIYDFLHSDNLETITIKDYYTFIKNYNNYYAKYILLNMDQDSLKDEIEKSYNLFIEYPERTRDTIKMLAEEMLYFYT